MTHKFPGYNFYYVDRSGGRDGGGVALYFSEKLTGDIIASYDNSVCGLLIVKTTPAEFKDMKGALDKSTLVTFSNRGKIPSSPPVDIICTYFVECFIDTKV